MTIPRLHTVRRTLKKHRVLHWGLVGVFLLTWLSSPGPVVIHVIFGYLTVAFLIAPTLKWLKRPAAKRRTLWSMASGALMIGLLLVSGTGFMADSFGGIFSSLHAGTAALPLLAAVAHTLLALKLRFFSLVRRQKPALTLGLHRLPVILLSLLK